MIETALRTKLLANLELSTLLGGRVYIGDTPYTFSYPFIRITSSGDNPDNYNLKNRMVETIAVDVFAAHNPNEGLFGYGILNQISTLLRKQFDAFFPVKWSDFEVQNVEYRGFAVRKNAEAKDMQKPTTLTITYNTT
jgi:hypothetical protein